MKVLSGKKFLIYGFFLIGVFLLQTTVALAQQDPMLELKTIVEKETKVKKGGTWVLEKMPVSRTGPGDILIYTTSYLNAGKGPAVDAEIVNPVPRGLVLVPDGIEGKDTEIQGSLDNGRTWQKMPVKILTRNPDGTETAKPAPADRYTHVKWIVKKPVAPGQSGRVSFKATVK